MAVTYFSDKKNLQTMPGGVYQGPTGPGANRVLMSAPGVEAPAPKRKTLSSTELSKLQGMIRLGSQQGPTLPPDIPQSLQRTPVSTATGGSMQRFSIGSSLVGGGGVPGPGSFSTSGNEWWRPLLDTGTDWIRDRLGISGGENPGSPGVQSSFSPCGTGYVYRNGRCEKAGLEGFVERTLPGGDTGYYGANFQPTQAFGMAGFVPQAMQTQKLICPKGYVLYGKEPGMEVCLHKGALPNKHRKWPKGARPVMTAQDAKTLRRAASLQSKVKRIAQGAGFSCRKR